VRKTYTITKGTQYDREGAVVTAGPLTTTYSGPCERMDGTTGLVIDSGFGPAVGHEDAVEAAVLRVIASGQSETLTLGEDAPSRLPARTDIEECQMYDEVNGCPHHGELCAK